MSAPTAGFRLRWSWRAVRLGRVVAVLLGALAAGLACDWFRPHERLVFPRPLPVFSTTPAAR